MKKFPSYFFCKLHLKLCYFYLMGYNFVLLFFRQNLSNWSRWKLKNVRHLFDFVAFYKNNTISIEFETQNYTFHQTFLILSMVVEKRRKICYCFFIFLLFYPLLGILCGKHRLLWYKNT
jgi:hypothetical protein